jgi:hypothetical protein
MLCGSQALSFKRRLEKGVSGFLKATGARHMTRRFATPIGGEWPGILQLAEAVEANYPI